MTPYFRIENLKNHTLSGGTYLYSPYMGIHPTPPSQGIAPFNLIQLNVYPRKIDLASSKLNPACLFKLQLQGDDPFSTQTFSK